MNLLVATRSGGKQGEFRRLLEPAGHVVLFPDDAGVSEGPEEASLEAHDSLAANARAKAEYFARRSGLPTVADDSGLEVLSLGGAPGVRSRRWAGVDGPAATVDAANNTELLRRLGGAPEAKRRARYRCVLAFFPAPDAVAQYFEGECGGVILGAPRGRGGFGYDALFFSNELGKTFGEATPEEKDAVSHRGRALRALAERLARS
jgi:XTP/dITP diphosphohydrolase